MEHFLTSISAVASAIAAIAALTIAVRQASTAKRKARANALASRIAFYNEVLTGLRERQDQLKSGGVLPPLAKAELDEVEKRIAEAYAQRNHLGGQLD
jgi:hypothetical protein